MPDEVRPVGVRAHPGPRYGDESVVRQRSRRQVFAPDEPGPFAVHVQQRAREVPYGMPGVGVVQQPQSGGQPAAAAGSSAAVGRAGAAGAAVRAGAFGAAGRR
ncbi:hypothetical protein HFP71_07225 [Streptomyces sp. ARC32]